MTGHPDPCDCPSVTRRHIAHLHVRQLARGTIYRREWLLDQVRDYLHGCDSHLLDATPDYLRGWQQTLTCGPDGRRGYTAHVRGFYGWAADLELCSTRLRASLIMPRARRRLPRPIREADLLVALIGAPRRIRPWLLIAAYTGLRAAEIAQVRAEDLDLDRGLLMVVNGKGGRDRVVPMPRILVAELRSLGLPVRGWAFPRLSCGTHEPTSGHVTGSQVSHLSNRYLHATGTASTLHSLRHRFATDVLRESNDLLLVRDLLGHSSVQTTQIYAATPSDAARVVEAVAARRLRGQTAGV